MSHAAGMYHLGYRMLTGVGTSPGLARKALAGPHSRAEAARSSQEDGAITLGNAQTGHAAR
jgi:hypothetical protein